ncbi:MAG: Fic family protein [Hyphomicrobiaceae bacterium]
MPATDILRRITQPLASRKPVGYNRAFLDGYRPNRSSYLTPAERTHLAELGRTSMPAGAAGTYAQNILQRLLIDLSWNSSRLEGNTYSLLDTERLIALGEAAEGKAPTDAQMILNHKAAIEFLVQSAATIAFDRRTLLNLHALLADNLLPDPRAPGRLRTHGVGIAGSVFHPLAVPQLIDEGFEQILATASAIRDPFEQALFVMVQLPYLQPFDDVNKRVSRLAANIPLIRQNLAPLSFVDVPDAAYTCGMLGVYELNRTDLIKDVFLWAYERSAYRYAAIRQTMGEPDPFRLRHRATLREVIAAVVDGAMDKRAAAAHIAAWAAAHIAQGDRARFIETAETELLGLHEGNFARYPIRPSAFDAWQKVWAAQAKTKARPRSRARKDRR